MHFVSASSWTRSLLALAVAAFLLVAGCQRTGGGGERTKASPPVAPSRSAASGAVAVDVVAAVQRATSRQIELTGVFTADEVVSLGARLAGHVEAVTVDMGDPVSRGQVLVRLESRDILFQVDVQKAKLREALAKLGLSSPTAKLRDPSTVPGVKKAAIVLENARIKWQRSQALRQEDLISDKDVSDAKAAYLTAEAEYQGALNAVDQGLAGVQSAQAALQQSEQQLHDTVLTSPMDGFVKQRMVNVGDLVQVGNPVLILVRSSPVHLDLDVPEVHLPRLAIGERVDVRTDVAPGRTFEGVVDQVSPTVDPTSRQVRVRARLLQVDAKMRPGAFGRATLTTSVIQGQVMVPEDGVVTEAGRSHVFVAVSKAGRVVAHRVPVAAGVQSGSWVAVTGAIRRGDPIVVSDLAAMAEGVLLSTRVSPSKKTPSSPTPSAAP